ncbi:MAG: hypothetical protein Q9160_007097 [Pyrenula sp. 1 TL-2023]
MLLSTFTAALSEHWFAVSMVIVIANSIAQSIYDYFFHPLASVPDPFLCKISSLPSFYHACLGDRHIWIWQLFPDLWYEYSNVILKQVPEIEMAGDRIRCHPNTVLFDSREAYDDIYNMKVNVSKSKVYTAWLKNKRDTNTLFTVDIELHAQKRRILNQVFTEKSIRAWSDSLTFDILGDLCFGKSFETKEPGNNPFKAIPHAVAKYMHFMYALTRFPFVDLVIWLKPRGLNQLLKSVAPPEIQKYYDFVDESVTKRLLLQEQQKAKPERAQRQDMFHFLCEAKDPATGESAYTDHDLRSEANLLIIAGSDTTATSLCGIFFYLTRNERPYTKVVQEICSTFTSAEEIVSGPKLLSCHYLRACIDEGLRITPVGPSELSREVRPGGLTVNGQYVPAGVIIGTVPWATSRDE